MLGTEAVVLGSPQGSVGRGGGLLGLEKWNPVHLRDLEDLLVLKKSTSWEIVISHVQIPPQSTSVSLSYITPPTHVLLLLTLLPLPFLQTPDSLHQTSPHPYPPPRFVHALPASSILSPAKPCPHAQPWPLSSAPPLTDAGPPLLLSGHSSAAALTGRACPSPCSGGHVTVLHWVTAGKCGLASTA